MSPLPDGRIDVERTLTSAALKLLDRLLTDQVTPVTGTIRPEVASLRDAGLAETVFRPQGRSGLWVKLTVSGRLLAGRRATRSATQGGDHV